ncbi:hypothetical protein NEAUS03_1092 [Nematocida ausubeli]|nr:hypothetical protein NEAUS03_1092 [Nematocida ausubeli]
MTAITKNRTNKIIAMGMAIVIAIAFVAVYLVSTEFGKGSSDKDASPRPKVDTTFESEKLNELKSQKEKTNLKSQMPVKDTNGAGQKSTKPNPIDSTNPEAKELNNESKLVDPTNPEEKGLNNESKLVDPTNPEEKGLNSESRPVDQIKPEVADKKSPFILMRAFNYIYTPIKNGVDSIQNYLYSWYARLRYGAKPIQEVQISKNTQEKPQVIVPTTIESSA